jgi:hypothetical protein
MIQGIIIYPFLIHHLTILDSPDDVEVRPKLPKEPVSITNKLKVQARRYELTRISIAHILIKNGRRAISVGEAIPPSISNESDSDSDTEFRPWKSQMEFRTRVLKKKKQKKKKSTPFNNSILERKCAKWSGCCSTVPSIPESVRVPCRPAGLVGETKGISERPPPR